VPKLASFLVFYQTDVDLFYAVEISGRCDSYLV